MTTNPATMQPGDGLLLVDVQNDFCPGGKLPIAGGDQIVPLLNTWIKAAGRQKVPVYASRDWHPIRHLSFIDQGGAWPVHCLADSVGARFHSGLELPESLVIITKGVRFDRDQNSVFDGTGFSAQLERDRVRRLWVGGLALDVCVLASVQDGLAAGLEMVLIKEATRPVSPEGGARALQQMREAGAKIF